MEPNDPRMDDVHCGIAKYQYGLGSNGLKIAEGVIEAHISALLDVRAGRELNPDAFPTYGPDASAECAARRIVACLLDAGWRPPDAECLELPQQPTDHTI